MPLLISIVTPSDIRKLAAGLLTEGERREVEALVALDAKARKIHDEAQRAMTPKEHTPSV